MLLMKDYSADKQKKKTEYADKRYARSIIGELKKYGFSYAVMNEDVKNYVLEKYPDARIKKIECFDFVEI